MKSVTDPHEFDIEALEEEFRDVIDELKEDTGLSKFR